jgi:hypothetical protein
MLMSLLSGEYPAIELTQPAWGSHCIASERTQQFFYCYGRLPSDSPDVIDVFIGRYQTAHIISRDRCIATVLRATVCMSPRNRVAQLHPQALGSLLVAIYDSVEAFYPASTRDAG